MSDIDREGELWKALKQASDPACNNVVNELYLIATRHRDEAVKQAVKALQAIRGELCERIAEYHDDIVPKLEADLARYRADAERLQAKLAETPWEVIDRRGKVIGRFDVAAYAEVWASEFEGKHTVRHIDAARAAEQERK